MREYPWRAHDYVCRGDFCSCPCANVELAAPLTRDELAEALEGYKSELESEIAALERRIKALKEKDA